MKRIVQLLKSNDGFTLAELLVVLFIIAAIGGIGYIIGHFISKFW